MVHLILVLCILLMRLNASLLLGMPVAYQVCSVDVTNVFMELVLFYMRDWGVCAAI
jgi:hypothetical protein